MAESLSGHQALSGPSTSQMPWEGRGFWDIRQVRGPLSHPSEKPMATIAVHSWGVVHGAGWGECSRLGLFLTRLFPTSPLSPTSPVMSTVAPIGAQADMGG